MIVAALVAALMGVSASAQSPSAAATAAIARFAISEEPPQFWAAEGGTQASWMAFRQRCADIGAELTRRQGMTYQQFEASPGLSFSRDEMLRCTHFLAGKATAGPALSPSAVSPAITPTPMNTPLPPQFPVGPESSVPDTSGPPTAGQPFAGGSASACQNPPAPNVGAQTPPLDVAADVSPSQNVEMLNQGLWVFDKSGTVQGSGPESLYAFWCGSPGANGNPLPSCAAIGNPDPVNFTDTQIAYDSIDQGWLATTLILDSIKHTGDLIFAISTGTSALDVSGAWERYDIPVCAANSNGYIFPDQPILGYSSSWAAVDTICDYVRSGFRHQRHRNQLYLHRRPLFDLVRMARIPGNVRLS